ncbi:MAG: hypothetical protein ACYTG0_02845 [Planctomycetota bacterium]|jgi:hypothetical protein
MTSRITRRSAAAAGIFLLLHGLAPAAEVTGPSPAVFDTGTSSPVPLSSQAVAGRDGWTKLPKERAAPKLQGDAVLSNDRITVVFRTGGAGAEIYSHRKDGPILRAVLTPTAGKRGLRIASVAAAENTMARASVDVAFGMSLGEDATVRFELQLGQVFVKTEPRGRLGALRVEAPCRLVVMPDFFADDVVVEAAELPSGNAELPGENFLLHMVGRGEAIVSAVWSQREEDIRVAVVGEGKARRIRASQIPYGTEGYVCVAVLEGPAIWHRYDVAKADADRIIRLDWKAPFAAQWRVDWRQDDGLTDSWEMLLQKPGGNYVKPDWFGQPASYGTLDWMGAGRDRWTTVLGRFQYPCWIDHQGRGFIQPLKRPGKFEGPAVLYPLNRVPETPLESLTVVDLMRSTLGVGPCQYVLDVEGQKKQSAGIPTCDARSQLNAIYAHQLQKEGRAEVQRILDDVLAFIRHIRTRIEDYVTFGHEMLGYLQEQKKVRPELADFLSEMEKLAGRIDAAVAARRGGIATPEYATRLVEGFRATLVGYEGDDALARCKEITSGFVKIGGNQDELVGECRLAVRILRQKAALAMAVDPRTTPIAKEIRRRTQAMLRNPVSYEAPRH